MADYDYDYALALSYKAEGLTNEQCAKLFGFSDESGFRKKHARAIKRNRDGNNHVSKRPERPKHNSVSRDNGSDRKEYHQNLTLEEIRRTKYGKIEPTGYISPLKHIDWLRYYFGEKRYEWDQLYLTALQDMMWLGNWQIGHAPRFGGKTITWQGMTAREIVERVEPLMTICSPKRPKTLFRGVNSFVTGKMQSAKLRRDYGDMIAVENGIVQANKSDLTMWVSDEVPYNYLDPVFRVASRETDIIGSHPVHIHFEDISQSESENETNKLMEWYEDVVRPMLSLIKGINSRLTATSTRKSLADFDSYLMNEQSWTNEGTWFKAIEGRIPSVSDVTFNDAGFVNSISQSALDQMTLYNPFVDPLKLVDIAIRSPISFASQYQNDPIPRGGTFFSIEEWLENTMDITQHPQQIRFVNNHVWIDPAWGKSASSSDTAIIVTSIINNKMVVLDASIGKFNPNELEDEGVRLSQGFKCLTTNAENNFAQVTSRFMVNSKLRRLHGFRTFDQKTDKIQRIDSLKGAFSTGRIEFHISCGFKDKIKRQFLKYDRTNKSWDILDIIATAYQESAPYLFMSTNRSRAYERIT